MTEERSKANVVIYLLRGAFPRPPPEGLPVVEGQFPPGLEGVAEPLPPPFPPLPPLPPPELLDLDIISLKLFPVQRSCVAGLAGDVDCAID